MFLSTVAICTRLLVPRHQVMQESSEGVVVGQGKPGPRYLDASAARFRTIKVWSSEMFIKAHFSHPLSSLCLLPPTSLQGEGWIRFTFSVHSFALVRIISFCQEAAQGVEPVRSMPFTVENWKNSTGAAVGINVIPSLETPQKRSAAAERSSSASRSQWQTMLPVRSFLRASSHCQHQKSNFRLKWRIRPASLMPKMGGLGTPKQAPQVHMQQVDSPALAWFNHRRKP